MGLEAGWNCHISLSSDACALESHPASVEQSLDLVGVAGDSVATYAAKLSELTAQTGRLQGDLGKRRFAATLTLRICLVLDI